MSGLIINETEGAPEPKQSEKELEVELKKVTSPFLTAEAFGVEDLIDPRETRPYLCRFVKAMQSRLKSDLGPKPGYDVRP